MGKRGRTIDKMSERSSKRFGYPIGEPPQPKPQGVPICPGGLTPVQVEFWTIHAPILHQRGDLNPATNSAFLELCRLIGEKAEVINIIEAEGRVILSGRTMRAHPLLGYEKTLSHRIFEYLKAFRLLPSDEPAFEIFPYADDPYAEDAEDPFKPPDEVMNKKKGDIDDI